MSWLAKHKDPRQLNAEHILKAGKTIEDSTHVEMLLPSRMTVKSSTCERNRWKFGFAPESIWLENNHRSGQLFFVLTDTFLFYIDFDLFFLTCAAMDWPRIWIIFDCFNVCKWIVFIKVISKIQNLIQEHLKMWSMWISVCTSGLDKQQRHTSRNSTDAISPSLSTPQTVASALVPATSKICLSAPQNKEELD